MLNNALRKVCPSESKNPSRGLQGNRNEPLLRMKMTKGDERKKDETISAG